MIDAIFVAGKSGQLQQQVSDVEVREGLGITGDRHFKKYRRPGQNITFIENEVIEDFNARFNQKIELQATRRNVVTRGVDLNALVGKEFSIGKARFRGVELCQPCIVLGRWLKNEGLSEKEVISAFWGRGGLRAEVINGGILSVGMGFEI